ncbi:MAG: radical SAM protein [Candidatus Omnitrophica bacterium]|nr:radical SAM protein [Candidatus Omnitrophota bacterium]
MCIRDRVCSKQSTLISAYPGVCLNCIRNNFSEARRHILECHRKIKELFNLPTTVSQDRAGILCNLCVNRCRISQNQKGLCGLRKNMNNRLEGVAPEKGNLVFYFDNLPTNCVADFVCPAGTGYGYPLFAYKEGPEYGYKNLAVFYNGCSFNCLFCQNWHYRKYLKEDIVYISPEELAEAIDENTSCICYFGGDPSCQLPHSILTSQIALKIKKNRILRICWETNGSMDERLLEEIVAIALQSGGCIKFDLKAWSEELNIALCGVSNQRTLENFKRISRFIKKKPEIPLLVASTLLVPGYIDEQEIRDICRFISSLDKNIPYSLLGFSPSFFMRDLPFTSRKEAFKARKIALEEGLNKVYVGNIHILS